MLQYLLFLIFAICTLQAATVEDLDPGAQSHIPIGIPNSVDTLKTFVEAEGCFSPGFATFGVYAWVRDADGKLYAATQPDSGCTHGLASGGLLIPWSEWNAGGAKVRSEVCQLQCASPAGEIQLVAQRIELTNPAAAPRKLALFVALRALGPAGWPVKAMSVDGGDALLVDGHTAVVAVPKPQAAGVSDADNVGALALAGNVPEKTQAATPDGNCSGALRFDLELPADGRAAVAVFCPVLAGRRAVGHQWDPHGSNNFKETAVYNAAAGGQLQPDPGAAWCRGLDAKEVFAKATEYWRGLAGKTRLVLPDRRWSEAFTAIAEHIAMNLNEDAPDVAVINYTTYNRDGMYNTEVLQQAGMNALAARAIDYLYAHPFNGRPYPEADNPGQILWVTAQHWQYTRDRDWLKHILPSVKTLAALIRYCRTTPPPHWVEMDGLECGDAVPAERRKELKAGACDGFNPNYTEAYDVAGLRAAALLCAAAGEAGETATWSALAEQLMQDYDQKFGAKLRSGYGSYSVLWPCRLYPLDKGKAFEQFRGIGQVAIQGWPYFGPATAHQGLLAGNREAGHATLDLHLNHPQMQGWYAFDETGASNDGGWAAPLRTRWKKTRAMPHGWAIAEVTLLLRDSLAFEDGNRLVLLGGIPPAWFCSAGVLPARAGETPALHIENLPTFFGPLNLHYTAAAREATLTLDAQAKPPAGFVLRWPAELKATFTADGKALTAAAKGDVALPTGTREVKIAIEGVH